MYILEIDANGNALRHWSEAVGQWQTWEGQPDRLEFPMTDHDGLQDLRDLIRDVVSGDLDAFMNLVGTNPPGWQDLANSDITFVLTAPAVRRVLLAHGSQTYPPELIRQWGEFMRFGIFRGDHRGPRRSISIDYDLDYDPVITEAVSRLSELGDEVDGEISEEMLADLCRSLETR